MLMAKAPGSWSSFLAKVIGLGSMLWLLAQFQWIWLANIVDSGYWPGLLTHIIGEGPRFLDRFFVSLGSCLLAHYLGPGKLSRR